MIEVKDIHWIAGFLEGEGSFALQEKRTCIVSATQVQKEPLERLQKLLGGTLATFSRKAVTGNIYNRWTAVAHRAIGIMFTVYPLMSPKRKGQIEKAILGWKMRPGRGSHNRNKTHCPNGHPYDSENTFINVNNGGRNCLICKRKSAREYLARNC